MQNPRLASRYAKSILDLALEKGQLEQVYADMLYLQQLTKGSREFMNLLRSQVVANEKKLVAIDAVISKNVTPMTEAFAKLLVRKNRDGDLPAIIDAFIQQYKDEKGIYTVNLTTAVAVSDSIKEQLVEQVKKTSGLQNIELSTVVDPNIIGGFVLQMGDKFVDASVAYDLKQISRQFDNNDFVYRMR